jgi:alpha-tubulin suppressor-like RCC1 family protein
VDDRLFGFGTTSALGLGDVNVHYTYLPTEITALRGIPMKKIETVSHTLALTQNGEVYAWGSNQDFK